jgi:hypothetical protein
VTGNTTITSISPRPAGFEITLIFDAALTITYNAVSLILQNSTNLNVAAGDVITFVSEGSGNWREKSRRLATAPSPPSPGYILIMDEKASGTDGGTFTSGAWRTRDLNTEVVDVPGAASVASNQITLVAGTYRLHAFAPAHHVNQHKVRFQNVTDGVTVAVGTSGFSNGTYGDDTFSVVVARVTISTTKTFELQHICQTTFSGNGLGTNGGANTGSVVERYAVVELFKEA